MTAPSSDFNTKIFEAALLENCIPPAPTALVRISQEMHKEEPDFLTLSQVINTDVALAGALVKLANSPYFGGGQRRASDAHQALTFLGLNMVSSVVACITLRNAFPQMPSMERFWDASVKIAILSGWLATEKRWPGVHPEEAYTYGLFRDCGVAVLMQHFPDYLQVLQAANNESIRSFTDIESEHLRTSGDFLPTNHAIMGAMMTQSWWLPESICQAVRQHHSLWLDSNDKGLPYRYLIAISQLAEHLVQEITGHSKTCEWAKLGAVSLEQLGITEDEIPELQARGAELLAVQQIV